MNLLKITQFFLAFLQARSINMSEYANLLRKHHTELSNLDKVKKELIENNLKEIEELQKQCELNGGHVADDVGFMYSVCVKCGMLGS